MFLGNMGVALPGLNQTEIRLCAGLESIVSVEKDFRGGHKIDGGGGIGRSGSSGGEVEPIVVGRAGGVIDLSLNGPNQFLDRVIEVEAKFVVGSISEYQRFRTLELDLINQVFVTHLSESSAFVLLVTHYPPFRDI